MSQRQSNVNSKTLLGRNARKSVTPNLTHNGFAKMRKPGQEDLYNSGMPEDNPFQTMYQKTIGSQATMQRQRAHTSKRQPMSQMQTPQKEPLQQRERMSHSQAKIQFSPHLGSNRRFGQYQGVDGGDPEATGMTANPFQQLPTGYEGARMTRCTDRFVRYPYPKLFSNYRQSFPNKYAQTAVKNHKKAFNLEKESKIINPHRMDLATTHNQVYTGRKGLPKDAPERRLEEEPKPIVQMSSYMASFPNWDNGKKDIFHEKSPQFPYYSLPFQGHSTYKKAHTEEQMRELRRQQKLLAETGRTESALKLGSYVPTNFEFTTTNSQNFKDFRFVAAHPPERVKKCNPIVHSVQTKSLPGHFKTINSRELKKHQVQQSLVDRIPYP